MKITKRGEIPDDKIWLGTCNYCNSEAEASRGELKGSIQSDSRDHIEYAIIECPVCKKPYSMYFYPKNDKIVKANQAWIRE